MVAGYSGRASPAWVEPPLPLPLGFALRFQACRSLAPMDQIPLRFGAAQGLLRLSASDCIARVDLTGPLTGAALKSLIAQAMGAAAGRANGWIVDIRGAVVAAAAAEVDGLFLAAAKAASPSRPVALLVAPHQYQGAKCHASRMALADLHRRAFTSPSRAEEWVASMARWAGASPCRPARRAAAHRPS